LWLFGNNVEDQLGHVFFVLLYFAGGMFAWLAHGYMMTGEQALQPAIGASGAVAAVLGAYAIRFPHARVRSVLFIIIFFTIIELPAMFVLGIWFVGQLFDAFADQHRISGGVAWWAHVGGFVAGLVLMPVLSKLAPGDDHPQAKFRI
jgi:membrane associated rhomboid family serine protease